eukprot:jgi/Astpho2/1086/Aster-x0983
MKRTWDQRERQPPQNRQHQAVSHQGHCSSGLSPQQHPWQPPPSPAGRQSVHWQGDRLPPQSQGDEDSWRTSSRKPGGTECGGSPAQHQTGRFARRQVKDPYQQQPTGNLHPGRSSSPSTAAGKTDSVVWAHLQVVEDCRQAQIATSTPAGGSAGRPQKRQRHGSLGLEVVEVRSGGAVVGEELPGMHAEIKRFVEAASPTQTEVHAKAQALHTVSDACRQALQADYPGMEVVPFGSHVSGLQMHFSDIDVVVTGFRKGSRGRVAAHLRRIVAEMRRKRCIAPVRDGLHIIAHARMPIIKVKVQAGGLRAPPVCCDISIGSNSGPAAVHTLLGWQRRFPMLHPLCLCVKALLSAHSLHDASTGGLSSFSQANMMMAHLLQEEKAGRLLGAGLGSLLLSFLQRYGYTFNYALDAVSSRLGGIVLKTSVPAAAPLLEDATKASRLLVEDPNTLRDVAGGSHRFADVKKVLADAATELGLARKKVTLNSEFGLYTTVDLLPSVWQPVHGQQ